MTKPRANAATVQLEPLTEAAAGLLQARGLDLELVERFGIQSVVRRRPRASGDQREWIAFPHFRGERIVHYEYRTVGPGELDCFQSNDGVRCFWNEDVLFDASLYGQDLIITEGRLDSLACIQCGFPAVVSVCDGAPDPKTRIDDPQNKYSYVHDVLDQIKKFRNVILATDADNPGALLLQDLARIIGRVRCKWVNYRGAKDANELLRQSGEAALTEALIGAKLIEIPGLYSYDDLPPSPIYPAVACGIDGLDAIWRFRIGENSIVVGMPGSGKTTLLNCVSYGLATHHGWVTAWFSPEQPPEVHKRRLLHRFLEKPPVRATDQEMKRALDFVRAHYCWMHPRDEDEANVDWAIDMMEAAAVRHNAKIAIYDPYNEMVHDWPIGVTETDYVGRTLRRFNRAARDCGMHVVIVPHPTKMKRNPDGSYDPPDGYSCHGGANWFNKAYMGVSIHRVSEARTQVTTWKAKFQDDGNYAKLGKVQLCYVGMFNKFIRAPDDAPEDDGDDDE